MTEIVTIAHLTDVHLGPLAGFEPRYWNVKRGLGYLNWVRKRRHDHQRPVLDRIVADMTAQAPDHIAVTGDLANIGLPQEHIAALAWLQSLGPPEHVSSRSPAITTSTRISAGIRARGAGRRTWHLMPRARD